jgi:hypothetical protein
MDIGIGLRSTIPGIPGRLILEWASAAEQTITARPSPRPARPQIALTAEAAGL